MTHQAPPPNPLGAFNSNLGQLANTFWQSPDLAPIPNPSGNPRDLLNDLLRYPEFMQQSIAQAQPFADWGGITLKRMPNPEGKKLGDYYHLLDDAGRAVANMHVGYHPELKELYVNGLYGNWPARGETGARGGFSRLTEPNTLGPREIRSLVEELKRIYPEAEGVNALRVSGARGQARQQASTPEGQGRSTRARISLRPGSEKTISIMDFLDLMATTSGS